MSKDIDKYAAIQNAELLNCKVNNIPATIRHIYSKIGKTEELIARELIVGDVALGINYKNDVPVGLYTTDEKGKRIELPFEQNNEVANTPTNIISKYIQKVSNKLAPKTKQTNKENEITKPKKIIKTTIRNPKEQNIQTM